MLDVPGVPQVSSLQQQRDAERSRAQGLDQTVMQATEEKQELQAAAVDFCDKMLAITKQVSHCAPDHAPERA